MAAELSSFTSNLSTLSSLHFSELHTQRRRYTTRASAACFSSAASAISFSAFQGPWGARAES